MNFHRHVCATLLLGALALAGCTSVSTKPGAPSESNLTASAQPRYEIVAGRNADLVARLRAQPAPAQPQVSDGNTRSGDENFLREQGLVEIGIGYFPASDVQTARALALQRGIDVGADAMRIYPPTDASQQSTVAELIATYFVQLQLPFGADFRDLTPDERQMLGRGGVEIGSVIGRTPASAANLRSGDFVIGFNHARIENKAAFQALLQSHMGSNVTLTIRRGKVRLNRLIRLGTLPDAVRKHHR